MIIQNLVLRAAALLLVACVGFVGAQSAFAEDEAPPAPVVEVQQEPAPEVQSEPEPDPVPEAGPGEDGTAGEPGEVGEDAPPGDVPEDPAIIETGDAVSESETGVAANDNDVTTPSSGSGNTTIDVDNDATVDNDVDTTAETGDNAASSNGGAYIGTGDALASANVINVVNTNLFNSNGLIAFLNYIMGGGFDLRALGLDFFLNPTSTTGGCSLSGCSDGDTTINVDNTATITNDVIVRADTGGNSANGGDGVAIIETGNAYASGNLINVVNSSLVGSNYLLVVGNNFGNLQGDITLPGIDFFEALFAGTQGGAQGPLDMNIVNDGTVANSTAATAESGGNTANGSGSVIVTGDAAASATTVNQVNTNQVGGTSFMFLINVVGNWSGTVHGLPAGIEWAHTPQGIALMSATGGAADLSALTSGDSGCCGQGGLTLNATNTAHVDNNLEVYALTGDNYAGGEGGSLVSTGNAYASANSVNIVNTNILGRNWIFAIFNIFGDWNGNVSFGHPDLWVGAVAEAGNPERPNSPVRYCFTVSNTGDADAHNVLLNPDYFEGMLSFADRMTRVGAREGWHIGDIPRGETRERCVEAETGSLEAGRSVAVPLTVTATADETEEDMSDNSDLVTIVVESLIGEMFTGAGRAASSGEPDVSIKKSVSVSTTTLPATVDYTIVLRNAGGEVYRGKLTDTMRDPTGDRIYSRTWSLGTIRPDEEVTVTYSVEFNEGLLEGIYSNTATVTGRKGNSVDVYAVDLTPATAHAIIELKKGEPKVLGVQALGPSCAEYITSYIRYGAENDSAQVKRLQYFLRDFEHLRVPVDGVYGPATVSAVNDFQAKYESEVLGPWGMYKPSGFVYHTTRKKINELYCQGIASFPLSPDQQSEIATFKSLFKSPDYGVAPGQAPEAVPAYRKPAVLETTAPKPASDAIESGAQSFFDRLFLFGKIVFAVPEVNAQVR